MQAQCMFPVLQTKIWRMRNVMSVFLLIVDWLYSENREVYQHHPIVGKNGTTRKKMSQFILHYLVAVGFPRTKKPSSVSSK